MSFAFLHGSGGGRKPVLFIPSITIDYNKSVMTIADSNGDFAHYEVYAEENGTYVLKTTSAIKNIDLSALFPMHNEDINIKVKAIGADFVSSDFSDVIVWQYGVGTEGLAYTLSQDETYYICSGIGTATETNIEIGSIHNGLPVTKISSDAFKNAEHILSYYFPDSVSRVESNACTWDYYGVTPNRRADYKTMVFGRGVTYLGANVLNWSQDVKVIMLPQIPPQNSQFIVNSFGYKIYVPYSVISDYKTATNWVNYASEIYPLVNTVSDLTTIDTASYTKACILSNFAEYEYLNGQWEIVQ